MANHRKFIRLERNKKSVSKFSGIFPIVLEKVFRNGTLVVILIHSLTIFSYFND